MEPVPTNESRRRTTILRVIAIGLAISCSVLAASPALAQDLEHEGDAEHLYRNAIIFIVAGTYEAAEKDNIFTVGVEYERLITERVGLVATLEYLPSADAWVAVFPVVFRFANGLRVFGGPGLELLPRRAPGDGHETSSSSSEREEENLFLARVGGAYNFHLGGRFALVPNLSFDFVNEEHGWTQAFVYGVNLAIEF